LQNFAEKSCDWSIGSVLYKHRYEASTILAFERLISKFFFQNRISKLISNVKGAYEVNSRNLGGGHVCWDHTTASPSLARPAAVFHTTQEACFSWHTRTW